MNLGKEAIEFIQNNEDLEVAKFILRCNLQLMDSSNFDAYYFARNIHITLISLINDDVLYEGRAVKIESIISELFGEYLLKSFKKVFGGK